MTGWERIEQLMALGHSRTVALRIVKKENQAAKARKKEEIVSNNNEYIIVRYRDPEGKTRAWAYGKLEEAEEVRQLAAKHLSLYRAEKAKVRDPLATAKFIIDEEVLDEEQL